MAKLSGRLHKIQWSSQHSDPPAGAPRVLAEVFTIDRNPPAGFYELRTAGGGYSCTESYIEEPSIKELSQKSLASVRRKRLARRVTAKVPLFADFFIQQAIDAKPDFYNGITGEAYIKARNEVLEMEAKRFEFLKNNIGKIIVYGEEPIECKERAARLRAEVLANQQRHLTKRALDGGDSAPQSAVSTPEVLSPSLSDSASRPAAQ
jgi:hypothetical protein